MEHLLFYWRFRFRYYGYFLTRKKLNPNSAIKFAIGLLLLGLGFVIFALAANKMNDFAKTPFFFLILGYFIQTVGELFLSPIGLSKMTELSPAKYSSLSWVFGFDHNFTGSSLQGKLRVNKRSDGAGEYVFQWSNRQHCEYDNRHDTG